MTLKHETHNRSWQGKHSLEGERIVTIDHGVRLRARISRDSYDLQSYGRVELLTTATGWQYLAGRNIMALDVGRWNAYGNVANPAIPAAPDWEDDMDYSLDELINLGIRIMA